MGFKFVFLLLVISIIGGCSGKNSSVLDVTELSGNYTGKIIRDDSLKTTVVNFEAKLADIDEMEAVTIASCQVWSKIFYDKPFLQNLYNELQGRIDRGTTKGHNRLSMLVNFPNEKYVKGYQVTEFNMKFIDLEDGSTIADCKVTGNENNDFFHNWYNTTSGQEEINQRDQLLERLDNPQ